MNISGRPLTVEEQLNLIAAQERMKALAKAREAERLAARELRCAWVDSWRSGSAQDKEAFSNNYDTYQTACAKVDELEAKK